MGMALAAITDNGDLLVFDQLQIGVTIIINAHFFLPHIERHAELVSASMNTNFLNGLIG
jgi:hypothetical protein